MSRRGLGGDLLRLILLLRVRRKEKVEEWGGERAAREKVSC